MKILERLHELERERSSGDLVDGRWRLTYARALERSRRTAAYLAAELAPGDRIAVGVRDDAEVTILFLACLRSGVVPLFVDPDATAAEVGYLMGKAHVKLVLAEVDLVERWFDGVDLGDTRIVTATFEARGSLLSRWMGTKATSSPASYPACVDGAPSDAPEPEPRADDLALILYTSGTTAGPKLVPLTRGNLVAQARTMTAQLELDADARVLNLMPITHVDGLLTGILTTFWCGGTMLRLEPFTVPGLPRVLAALYKYRATHAVLVPTLIALILRDPEGARAAFEGADFRYLISTAASLPDELWRRFEDVTGKPIVNMYGMSEVGNLIFAGPGEASRRIGAIGVAADCEIRIVDDDGRPVAPGDEGELWISGPSVTPGYLGQETPFSKLDGRAWFPTGDLVVREPDDVLRLVGRKKDIVITGGNNVAPDEVNRALLAHPAVVEAATFGVPDDVWGERIVACVVADGAERDEILAHVSERLAPFKVPRELHLLDELPKGRSGKVLASELATRVAQARNGSDAGTGTDVEDVVLDLAARSFRVPRADLTRSSRPQTCPGWDSMAHLDLVSRLERAFSVRFQPRDVMRLHSLSEAIDLVDELRR